MNLTVIEHTFLSNFLKFASIRLFTFLSAPPLAIYGNVGLIANIMMWNKGEHFQCLSKWESFLLDKILFLNLEQEQTIGEWQKEEKWKEYTRDNNSLVKVDTYFDSHLKSFIVEVWPWRSNVMKQEQFQFDLLTFKQILWSYL